MAPALAVLGACLAWGLDNNLTRRVSLNDAIMMRTTGTRISTVSEQDG